MPAAQMLARVLRDRVDSELFRTLYTGVGVPYSLGYLVTPRRASGDAVLYVVTLPEGVGIVRDTVESVLADIRQNGVDDAELRRARNQELGNFLLTHQTVDSRARQQGTDTALGTMRPLVEDRLAAVRAVTAEDVRRVAETYAQHILIAELGPER